MSRAWFIKRADDLSDDDDEALRQLSGGLYDGEPINSRHKRAPPFDRLRSRSFFRDRNMWWKYYTACLEHEPGVQAMREADERAMDEIANQIVEGKLKSIDDVDEAFIVEVLVTAARDTRSPMGRLKAAELLARMKGIDRPGGDATPDAALQDLLERALGRGTGPRGVVPPEDGEGSGSGETQAG